jgi:hypothetical protein
MIDSESLSWDDWAGMVEGMAFPGWTVCRFACLGTPADSAPLAVFVYGITHGPFGIWAQNYDVCAFEDGEHKQSPELLFNLTHTPSGKCVGLFLQRDHAALAADTALRACPAWDAPVVEDATRARTVECWGKIGLSTAKGTHAHDLAVDVGPLGIVALTSVEEGRPEKLS